jgi:phosphotransferase family enzyme
MPDLVRRPEELSGAWLADALGTPVRDFALERIGTGQMSESYRVTLDWDGAPGTVVLKVAASDPTSRATGVGLGAYEREIRFYQEVAPRLDGAALARCHAAVFDAAEGWFTLLLADAGPAVQGDQIRGCTVDEARVAMHELGKLHAPVLGDPELGATPWLNQESPLNQALITQLWPGFLERYGDRVAPDHVALCERFFESVDSWASDRTAPLGLVHGDYRLDNLLFGVAGSPLPFCVVDWQTVGWGPAMHDASYMLGGGLTVEDRRTHEDHLLRTYFDGLGEQRALTWDACREGYRRGCFSGVLMAVAASMLVERTERGDEMFMTLLARHCQQAIDLDAVGVLSEPGAGRPAPLRPDGADEGRHPPGPEELWNESWYFDAAREDGSLGAYVRLGLYPRLGVAWYTAFIVGEGRPAVAVVDYEAPLPAGEALAVETGALRADHVCEEALARFRVTLDGTGEAFDDPAAALRGEAGAPVPVALDLVWETDGEPYAYRMATRYEIPCRVRGTLRVGDEELALDGPGQRDHSWGPRDWWSMDWVWSALHLDDGTRTHAVELRLPDLPRMGVGYVQADGALDELTAVTATEAVADDGLITSASLALAPAGLELGVDPVAFGPLRLVAPDGRVSEFPRALCRVRTADGRTGVGWLEWNRNRR